MKTKTINEVINHKFEAWLKSIDDEKVRDLVDENSILTGGAIASMLIREPVNDFDFYFRNKETVLAIANYYVQKFNEKKSERDAERLKNASEEKRKEIKDSPKIKIAVVEEGERIFIKVQSSGIASEMSEEKVYQYFESQPPSASEEYVSKTLEVQDEARKGPLYRPIILSANAISLSGDVQIVIRFYGEPDNIHENYDFVHATNYWTSWEKKVTLQKDALECLLTKELRYVGSKYPICSIIRARKFIQREWTINAGQLLKIAMQVHDLDLNNVDVLEEQLTGVDAAYFHELISVLKEKNPKEVDRTYLVEIIDRIFG